MATIFKELVTVNAPGKDVVFDGCDFVDGGRISVEAANSVTVTNCRFLDSHADGIDVIAETKLMVSYSYFCDNAVIGVNGPLADGSYISNNWFNGGNGCLAINNVGDDVAFTISNNVFKGESSIGIYTPGAPAATVKVFDNQFETAVRIGREIE